MEKYYGDAFVGAWYCANCKETTFPLRIREMEDNGLTHWDEGWNCTKCGNKMIYDEFA